MPRHQEGGPPDEPPGPPEFDRRSKIVTYAAAGALALNFIGIAPYPPTRPWEIVVRTGFALVSSALAGLVGYSLANRAR